MAAMLPFRATLPLQHPGFVAEAASTPMDEGEVRTASAGLTAATAELWDACMLMHHLEQPGRLIDFYAAASVAFAAYRAWEVAVVVVAWLVHVYDHLAVYNRLAAVAAPATLLLFFSALRAFL